MGGAVAGIRAGEAILHVGLLCDHVRSIVTMYDYHGSNKRLIYQNLMINLF